MARVVRLGLIQFVPEKWELETNRQRLLGILSTAGEGEFDLIVTPECMMDGYAVSEAPADRSSWQDRERWLRSCCLSRAAPEIQEIARQAERIGSHVILGFSEDLGNGRAANSAAVFDRGGEIISVYHKTHLQNHDLQFEPGRGWSIIESDFGRFGVLICADRRWPEAVRSQRLLGADLLANPTYGMHGDLNLAMMRTRAYENNFFIAFAHPRLSLVTGPGGEVEVNHSSEEGTLVRHTVDLDRANLSHIRDMREDLYEGCSRDYPDRAL